MHTSPISEDSDFAKKPKTSPEAPKIGTLLVGGFVFAVLANACKKMVFVNAYREVLTLDTFGARRGWVVHL